MSERKWVLVDEVAGDIQAELLRGLLEAQGIPVWLNQEGAGKAYGLGVAGMGKVQILVPSDFEEQARGVLKDYYDGKYEDIDWNMGGEDNQG
jgi:hypothetical protein